MNPKFKSDARSRTHFKARFELGRKGGWGKLLSDPILNERTAGPLAERSTSKVDANLYFGVEVGRLEVFAAERSLVFQFRAPLRSLSVAGANSFVGLEDDGGLSQVAEEEQTKRLRAEHRPPVSENEKD